MNTRRALRQAPTAVAEPLRADAVVVALEAAKKAPFGPVERQLVALMDGRRTVEDLALLAALSVHETTTVVARLVDVGVVRVELDVALDEDWEAIEPVSQHPTKRPPDGEPA